MSVISVCALAVVSAVLFLTLKTKNGELAVLLIIAASAVILVSVLTQLSQITDTVKSMLANAEIKSEYIVILLKATGICLVTEFAVNTCRDSGSQTLAGSVSLAGKLTVTVIALPLYSDILNTVISLVRG